MFTCLKNLFRRVEVAFPVESPELKTRVADDLSLYLRDDVQAWQLGSDGRYERVVGTTHTCAQTTLLNFYDERVALREA